MPKATRAIPISAPVSPARVLGVRVAAGGNELRATSYPGCCCCAAVAGAYFAYR
jgi:hypothetical protein